MIRKLGDGNICFCFKGGGAMYNVFVLFLGHLAQTHEHIAVGSCSHF